LIQSKLNVVDVDILLICRAVVVIYGILLLEIPQVKLMVTPVPELVTSIFADHTTFV